MEDIDGAPLTAHEFGDWLITYMGKKLTRERQNNDQLFNIACGLIHEIMKCGNETVDIYALKELAKVEAEKLLQIA